MISRFSVGTALALWAAAALAQSEEGGHSEHAVSAAKDTVAAAQDEVAQEASEIEKPVSILENFGNGGFPIATEVPEAQAFFDNGIELAFAFAHGQSIEAMAEAVRLDPDCVMCRAGHAYVLGPNLNYRMDLDARAPALEEAAKAMELAGSDGSEFERAFAAALVERFRNKGKVEDRDKANASAMQALATRYPEHDTLQVLAADAMMMAAEEREEMAPAMALLAPVLARNPEHTGAIHYYIHATEIIGDPAKAEGAADRLDAMNLQASHLVHMPSHTWYWVGRYQDAADANRRAVMIGEHEAMQMPPDSEEGVWGIPYHAHNVIFGLGGAMMADDSRTALMLARPLVERAQGREEGSFFGQLLMSAGYFALGRFESPQVVLALEGPKLPYLKAAWHYARGEAQAFLGNVDGVRAEIDAIPTRVELSEEDEKKRLGAADQMLAITRAVLTGRIAMMEGRYRDAAASFAEAAIIEETDDFSYFSDPPAFWYPVRRDAALAYFAAGDRDAALREAEKTLKVRPQDPVSLDLIQQVKEAAS